MYIYNFHVYPCLSYFWFVVLGSSGQNSLTREESAQLRMSDSYINDRNSTAVEAVPVRQITVSTGSFNKSTPGLFDNMLIIIII